MRKIWTSFTSLIASFSAIAQALRDISQKLTIIQQLYEDELAMRTPVWVRPTERPKPSDTEVLYSSDPPPRRIPLILKETPSRTRKSPNSH